MGFNKSCHKSGITTEKLKNDSLQRNCSVHLWRLSKRTIKSWTRTIRLHRGESERNENMLVKLVSSLKYYCDICGRRFSAKTKLKWHKRGIHPKMKNENIVCSTCKKVLPDRTTLFSHMDSHKSERFQCPSCGESFLINNRNRNIKTNELHEIDDSLKCSFCGETLINMSYRNVQKKLKTDEKPFKCPICGSGFQLFCYKRMHMKNRHSKNRPFRCSLCPTTFVNEKCLKQHERIHTGIKPYSCSICKQSFYTSAKQDEHLRRVHIREKSICCSMCNKSFFSVNELTIHLRSHTGERPFKCTECLKEFTCKSNLNRHLKIHGEKTFKCSLCKWSGFTNGELRHHVLNHHEKIKRFCCSMCDNSYYSFRDLTHHIRKHTGEKPFKCQMCKKYFTSENGFNLHMRTIHTVQPLFECSKCSKQYPYKSSVYRHMKCHKKVL